MLSRALTILLGVLLIAIITPLAQFLTIGALNASIETAAPVGWAVGLLFTIVLVFAALRLATRVRLPRANLVILYAMLTIAVPVMNLGLVRQAYLSMASVFVEYFYQGTSTYRTAYNARNAAWFPLIPDRAGLAWNRADRLLRLLEDPALTREKRDAARKLTREIAERAKTPNAPQSSQALISQLGVAELEALRAQTPAETLERLDLLAPLEARQAAAARESAAAAEALFPLLEPLDEYTASLLPANIVALDYSARTRLETELARTPNGAALEQSAAALAPQAEQIGALISQLSEPDRAQLRQQLADRALAQSATLSGREIDAMRESYVYRLTRQERGAVMAEDGTRGPNQNLKAFRFGVSTGLADQQTRARQTLGQNIAETWRAIPWRLWTRPILMWSALIVALFLLVMCVAEWFRRKWVDRENLAFPLVEIADNLIRHDARLETADDIRDPQPRARAFNALFLIGLALGFGILTLEALGHYGVSTKPVSMMFDVSKDIFTAGALKELARVIFVISPIVVGLLFLVNLEISFSIWVVFIAYQLVFWIAKSGRVIQDSLFTGYGGGKEYPFPMEQFLGASACFAVILVLKSFRGARWAAGEQGAFIPPRLNLAGLIVLPIVVCALLWSLGVTSFPMLLVAGLVVGAQTLAEARSRAETGLPGTHVSYEFAKLPMIFGMTGASGGRVFTSFIAAAFLPITLLFSTLAQHLENMELARRLRVRYGTIALASLAAFLTALGVGMLSFLVMTYYVGEKFQGAAVFPGAGGGPSAGIAHYPLWVSHFFGEEGLGKFTQIHWIRVGFIALGAAVFGGLAFLRARFLKFPVNPLGYLLLLSALWYPFVSPYYRGDPAGLHKETAWLWGSAFVAWMLKKIIIKYGGMNAYKASKPGFVGLVAGSVLCIFFWNMADLVCSIIAAGDPAPGGILKWFIEKAPYSSQYY